MLFLGERLGLILHFFKRSFCRLPITYLFDLFDKILFSLPEIYTARSAFLKEDITYEVINQKNIKYNAKSQELRSIYVNPPLCSIVQTADNMMDRNLIVVFAKLDKEGDMLAYILTRYPEDLGMNEATLLPTLRLLSLMRQLF